MSTSFVLEHLAANPAVAVAHFSSRLSLETDPSDVWADLALGNPPFVIVDCRSAEAYANAHIRGAISFPHRTINPETTAHLDKGTVAVVYCWGPACNAAHKGAVQFASLGFKVKEMIGGLEYWVREGLPIEGTATTEPDLVERFAKT